MKRLSSKQLATILVDACAGQDTSAREAIMTDFVQFLVQRQELFRVRDIIRQVDRVWQERYGVARVEVESAYSLSDQMRARLQTLTRGADWQERVRPELIGGLRLRLDDRLIDGTVTEKLMALQRTLSQ